MILGSHNSWSYLPPKKWWMKPFTFLAKCQDLDIISQYKEGVRCFDLRIRYDDDDIIVAHGMMEYKIKGLQIHSDLGWLNSKGNVQVRILHEARNRKQYTTSSIAKFKSFCKYCELTYTNTKFWCGKNLYNWETDYEFSYKPTCDEKYSSVCPPKILDDWYPRMYAKKNNKKILEAGTDKDILLIDFINYN